MKTRIGILLGVVLGTGVPGPVVLAQTAKESALPPARHESQPGEAQKNGSARAVVLVPGSKPRSLLPDLAGAFPSLRIPGDALVRIRITYPDGTPGEMVRIDATSAGTSRNERIESRGRLDDSCSLSIRLETTSSRVHSEHKGSSDPGLLRFRTTRGSELIRILLRKGEDEKILLFLIESPRQITASIHHPPSPAG
jgi:hypothetical protein